LRKYLPATGHIKHLFAPFVTFRPLFCHSKARRTFLLEGGEPVGGALILFVLLIFRNLQEDLPLGIRGDVPQRGTTHPVELGFVCLRGPTIYRCAPACFAVGGQHIAASFAEPSVGSSAFD
jgi:hypothetical protein